MLGTITLILRTCTTGRLPQFSGRYLHAAVFSMLSQIDSAAGAHWHDLVGIKPFTVALGHKEHRKDGSIQVGDTLSLQLSIWHRELWYVLEGIREHMPITIGPIDTVVMGVHYDTPFDLPMTEENDMVLVERCLTGIPAKRITMQFTEPTTFNGTYGEITFPTPSLIFSSAVDKWNAGDTELPLDKDRIRHICERIVITDWSGRTKRVYFGRDRGVTGFVGTFTMNLAKLTDEERQIIMILATFAMHTGIGRLSGQGLGRVEAILHTK